VTTRGEQSGTWWTLQFGYGFEEAAFTSGSTATPGRAIDHAYPRALRVRAFLYGFFVKAAGTSVEESTYLAVFLERAARLSTPAFHRQRHVPLLGATE
jgi:hypothetical protein